MRRSRILLHSSTKRLSLAISTYFCIEEQGMKTFEVLARGSAFIVNTHLLQQQEHSECGSCSSSSGGAAPLGTSSKQHTYGVLTASHIVAPWRWPKYYPLEWLQFVNSSHTKYILEVRDLETGASICEAPLLPSSRHHKYRDIALLRIDDEKKTVDRLVKEYNCQVLGLSSKAEDLGVGTQLAFHGHRVVSARSSSSCNLVTGENNLGSSTGGADGSSSMILSASDDRVSVPLIVNGSFREKRADQGVADTANILVDGMCGGPVVSQPLPPVLSATSAEEGRIDSPPVIALGLVEGVGSASNKGELAAYQGVAVFVDATELHMWTLSADRGEHVFYDEL